MTANRGPSSVAGDGPGSGVYPTSPLGERVEGILREVRHPADPPHGRHNSESEFATLKDLLEA